MRKSLIAAAIAAATLAGTGTAMADHTGLPDFGPIKHITSIKGTLDSGYTVKYADGGGYGTPSVDVQEQECVDSYPDKRTGEQAACLEAVHMSMGKLEETRLYGKRKFGDGKAAERARWTVNGGWQRVPMELGDVLVEGDWPEGLVPEQECMVQDGWRNRAHFTVVCTDGTVVRY